MLFSRSARAGVLALVFCSLAGPCTCRNSARSADQRLPEQSCDPVGVAQREVDVGEYCAGESRRSCRRWARRSGSTTATRSTARTSRSTSRRCRSVSATTRRSSTISRAMPTSKPRAPSPRPSRYSLQNSEQNIFLAVVQAYMGVIRDTQLGAASARERDLLPGPGAERERPARDRRGHQDRRVAGRGPPGAGHRAPTSQR